MDTAFKMMFALRQPCDLQLAALKDASAGHREVFKTAVDLSSSPKAQRGWTQDTALAGRRKAQQEAAWLELSLSLLPKRVGLTALL